METCVWFSTAKFGDEQISLKEHVERLTGETVFILMSRKTQICEVCKLQANQDYKDSLQTAKCRTSTTAEKIGDLITEDHKVLRAVLKAESHLH